MKAAAEVDYPAYGVTGPSKDVSPSGGDRKLASAQMYHYQHQKGVTYLLTLLFLINYLRYATCI